MKHKHKAKIRKTRTGYSVTCQTHTLSEAKKCARTVVASHKLKRRKR